MSYFNVAAFPPGPWATGAKPSLRTPPLAGAMVSLDDLEWDRMTDTGMWIWAGVFTVVGLVASYFIAVAWQRHKDRLPPEP